ncbi:hypothetical protein VB618_06345 [Microvirga sp. CF3062]|uniref:hypothetical protein n=1 Tax=Microvirga sp. CF3062 TaxID=3110182 RepID=UPI002E7868A4|nr:hypothetical protein [Microvirga sp. CF3062]MEE1655808.1 hypothetical protein [Microvirga sp. CF3062]
MKHFAKGLFLLNVLALAVTALAVWVLDRRSAVEMFDIATYVGLGMGALGGLMFFGSAPGVSASTGMAASAADQPSRIMDALWGDRTSSASTGAMLVCGGVSWIAIAWLLTGLLSAGS